MAWPDLSQRSQIQPAWLRNELEAFVALLIGYLDEEHDANGRHVDVTARTLTLSGALTAAGPLVAAGGITDYDRAVPIGAWTDVAFDAAYFTASGAMTWTVGAGDVATYAFMCVGKTMTVAWYLDTTTVGGTPSTELRIMIPGGALAARAMSAQGFALDNGVRGTAVAFVGAGASVIQIQRLDGAAWATSANQTYVIGKITFSIQ